MHLYGPTALQHLSTDDEVRFGAKAVNLGRMMAAGMPVPAGFAIALQESELQPDQVQLVVQAWRALTVEGQAVAVRSSAVGEDSADASYAGQHDSFLDVSDEAGLLRAIRACVASRGSERAAAYRAATGGGIGLMGVVVQRMAPAEHAGVCFTRAPERGEALLLEVVAGLGEALVSGQATPGRLLLERASLRTVEHADRDGVLQALGEAASREIASWALQAEEAFGQAMDLEWAWGEGSCHLLQARPITTLQQAAARERLRDEEIQRLAGLAGDRRIWWTDFSIADMLPSPSVMSVELFQRFALRAGGIGQSYVQLGFRYTRDPSAKHLFELICGRAYTDLGRFLQAVIPEIPVVLDGEAMAAGGDLDLALLPTRVDWSRPLRLLAAPFWGLRLLCLVPLRFLRLRRRLHARFHDQVLPALQAEAARKRAADLRALSDLALSQRFETLTRRLCDDIFTWHQLSDTAALGTRALLVRVLGLLYGARSSQVEVELTRALDGNFNTETNLALAQVAAGRLELEDFLSSWGQRGNPDWDPAAPRWREDSSRLKAMAELIARSGRDPVEEFALQRNLRFAARERLDADLRRHWLLRPFRRLVLAQLDCYWRYSPMRESTQGACYLWVELLRLTLLEGGRRLGCGDLLTQLSLEEAAQALAGDASLVERARQRRCELALARSIPLPHVLDSEDLQAIGRPPAVDASAGDLRGVVASTGVVEGRARVVSELEQARGLEPGEILVTGSTDPAWTPLFMVAGGLVLEQGGTLSHGAIVARELGLPALVGVAGATQRLKTGDRVLLDAERGVVALLDDGGG